MKRLIFSLVMLSVGSSYGQNIRGPIASPAPGVLDGVYVKEHIPTKKVVPYEYVREADVTWSKRVWSVIDLREKFNHPLYWVFKVENMRIKTLDSRLKDKRKPHARFDVFMYLLTDDSQGELFVRSQDYVYEQVGNDY